MILICGIASESPVRAAIEAAQRAGVEHVVFDQRRTASYGLSVELTGSRLAGGLQVDGEELSLDDFNGVYTRFMDTDLLAEHRGPSAHDARDRARMLQLALDEWLEAAPCRVANRTSAMASNVSKPYQAQLIRRAGMATPTTLVTNRPEEAMEFARYRECVFKSISSVRSIVQALSAPGLERVERVRQLPTQFQERIDGQDVRVHVVGPRVFATEIASPAVDYRYAARDGIDVEMEETTLPPSVANRCRRLAESLGLLFCGIDLMRVRRNSYVCFEVNPSPAYTYYEEATGQPISDALVQFLEHG